MALSLTIKNSSPTPISLLPAGKSTPLGEIPPGESRTFDKISTNTHLVKNQTVDEHPDAFLGAAPFFYISDLKETKLPWHGPGQKPHWVDFPLGGTLYPVKNRPGISSGSCSQTFYYRYRGDAGLSMTVDENFDVFADSISDTASGDILGVFKPSIRAIRASVLSAGLDDGNKAELLVDGRDVFKLGIPQQATRSGRGMNVAIVDENSGDVLDVKTFDTHGAKVDPFTNFLNDQPEGRVVIIAARDSAANKLTEASHQAVERIGSKLIRNLGFRDSWAIIGQVGAAKGTVYEEYSPRRSGTASESVLQIALPAVIDTAAPPVASSSGLCIDLHVQSHALNDGNDAVINVNGVDVFTLGLPGQPKVPQRGMNIAVIDEKTGHVTDVKNFDTFRSTANSNSFEKYIQGLHKGSVVVLAVKDEGSQKLTKDAKAEITKLGSSQINDLGYRQSWALIGQVGAPPGTVYEDRKEDGAGFVSLNILQVPLPLKIEKGAASGPSTVINGQVLGEIAAPGSSIDISVESKGAEDGDTAFISVQGRDVFKLNIPGQTKKTSRGMNIAEIDQVYGNVVDVKVFDVYGAGSKSMTNFLNEMADGRIVVMAVNDEGATNLDEAAKRAIERLGSKSIRKLAFRDSWCLVGQIGSVIGSVPEALSPKKQGGASLDVRRPLQSLTSHATCVRAISAGFSFGNYSRLRINGDLMDFSNSNGLNVAIVSVEGQISQTQAFDTSKDASASDKFASWVNGLPFGTCVALAVKNDASLKLTLPARDALRSLGARMADCIGFRDSYSLVGFKGAPAGTVAELYSALSVSRSVYGIVPEAVGGVAGINGELEGFSISMESSGSATKFGVSRIAVDGVDVGLGLAGLNVVVIDASSGIVLESRNFDTTASAGEADKFAEFIEKLTIGKLVAISVLNNAVAKLTERSKRAIASLGSRIIDDLEAQWSWVCFGRKGAISGSAQETRTTAGSGPVTLATWFRANGGTQDSYFDISVEHDGIEEEGSGGIIKVNNRAIGAKRTGLRVAVFDDATGALGDNKGWDLYFHAEQASQLTALINCREACVVAISQHDDRSQDLPGPRYSGTDESPNGSRPSWSYVGRVSDLKDMESSAIVKSAKSPSSSLYRFFPTGALQGIPASDVWLRSGTATESATQMIINGKSVDVSSGSGMHVSVIDGASGDISSSQTFDIAGDAGANGAFGDLIKSLDVFTLVAITVSGGVSDKLDEKGREGLRSLGSRMVDVLGGGESWALIGSVGNVPGGAAESVLSNGPIGVSSNMPWLKPKESGDEDLIGTANYSRVAFNAIPSDKYYAQFLGCDSIPRLSIKTPVVANDGVKTRRALLISSRTPSKTRCEIGVYADRVVSSQRRYLANVEGIDDLHMRQICRGEGQEATKARVLSEMTEIGQKASVEDELLISFVGYGVIESDKGRHAIKVWDDDARTKQVLLYDDEIVSAFLKRNKDLKVSCLLQQRYDDVPNGAVPMMVLGGRGKVEAAESSAEQLEIRLRGTNHCVEPKVAMNGFSKYFDDVARYLECSEKSEAA